MDARDMRELLNDYLREVDWSKGATQAELLVLVQDDEALTNVIGQYVADGIYRRPEDVLNVIPNQAWQDAQGDRWQGGLPPDDPAAGSGFDDSPVARH